jgi:hypothetical protein
MLGLVLVVSLLPVSWLAPWTHRASELVGLPLVPLGDGWMAVRHWLVRPSADEVITAADADQLEDENRLLRLERDQSREEARLLRIQLEQCRNWEDGGTGGRSRVIDARVVGTEPHASGELLFRINAGSARGVGGGALVVARSNVLLGEVVEGAAGGTSRTVSLVRPMCSQRIGQFEGLILREGEEDLGVGDRMRPRGMMKPSGDGWVMNVEAPASTGVRPGNEVVMVDPIRTDAFGFRVGRVIAVEQDTSNAQWKQVRIEPLLALEDQHSVELRIFLSDRPEGEAGH